MPIFPLHCPSNQSSFTGTKKLTPFVSPQGCTAAQEPPHATDRPEISILRFFLLIMLVERGMWWKGAEEAGEQSCEVKNRLPSTGEKNRSK